MKQDYDNPIDQMKSISWQLKRIADHLDEKSKPSLLSETYQFKPKQPIDYSSMSKDQIRDYKNVRKFLDKLSKDVIV